MSISAEVDLALEIRGYRDELRAERKFRRDCAGAIQLLPIFSTQQSGSGTINQPDALGAKTGYYWDIKRLTCYGFTAGTVTVYKNNALGEPVAPFLTNGAVFTYGKAQLMLSPGEFLVAVGTGITGTFQLAGSAICFETWYLPYYID